MLQRNAEMTSEERAQKFHNDNVSHIQIESLIKNQSIFHFINSHNLSLDCVSILSGENLCWSLLDLRLIKSDKTCPKGDRVKDLSEDIVPAKIRAKIPPARCAQLKRYRLQGRKRIISEQ